MKLCARASKEPFWPAAPNRRGVSSLHGISWSRSWPIAQREANVARHVELLPQFKRWRRPTPETTTARSCENRRAQLRRYGIEGMLVSSFGQPASFNVANGAKALRGQSK
jgi:hypothetical protein